MTNGLPKLKIPRKFTKFTLVDTSDNGRINETDIDAEIESVALTQEESVEKDGDKDDGCFGWMRTKWYWKRERAVRNHKMIIAQIEAVGAKIDTHESTLVEIEEELKKCKKAKNKAKARLLLLNRKRLTNTIRSYYNSRSELEQVLLSLEESSDQIALVKSYKTANSILKTTMRQRGGQSAVETYEDLADDLQEAQDDVHDLQEAVSRNVGRVDDDLLEELDELFDSPTNKKPKASSGDPPPHMKERMTDDELIDSLPMAPFPQAPSGIELTDAEAMQELESPLAA